MLCPSVEFKTHILTSRFCLIWLVNPKLIGKLDTHPNIP